MLNRLATTSLSLLLALSSYACGDDDESDDGGGTVDAGDDGDDGDDGEPDAGDDGADAGADDVAAITDPEGGQILFEYINFDSELADVLAGGAPTALRVMAYFMNSQTPESNPFPDKTNTIGGCINLYETGGFPLGAPDGVEGQKRAEIEVGDLTLIGQNAAGTDVEIAIPQITPKDKNYPDDDFSRTHDVFYQLIAPNAEDFVQPDSLFTISMSGADGYQESTYEDGTYMAGHFELGKPGLEENDIGLSTTSDTTVTWDPPEKPNQNVPDAESLIGGGLITAVVLGDLSTRAPVMFCPVAASKGEFTITAEVVASFRESIGAQDGEPTQAYMLRNNIAHTLLRLNNGDGETPYDPANKRRVDVVSVYCHAQLVNVGP